jgi:tRNA(Arg) A34 adenosine deaminase TadA
MDLIGINLIFELMLWMFDFSSSSLKNETSLPLVHLILSLTWFIPSMYFKTYEGNLKIAYNLKNSVYQLFVHILVLILISKLFGLDFFDYLFFSYYSLISIAYLPFSRYAIAFYLNRIDNLIPIRKRVTIIGTKPLITQLQGFLEAEHSGYRLLKLNFPKTEGETKLAYLIKAIEKAEESIRQGGFPAGAIVVKDNKIIGSGISIGNKLNDPTSHGELSSIRDACKNLKTSNLTGVTLYASMQPCLMCFSAVMWSGISRVVFACGKDKVSNEYYGGTYDISEINNEHAKSLRLCQFCSLI